MATRASVNIEVTEEERQAINHLIDGWLVSGRREIIAARKLRARYWIDHARSLLKEVETARVYLLMRAAIMGPE